MHRRAVIAVAWLACLLLSSSLAGASSEPERFPNLIGRNLLGATISLPADLPARRTIVLIGLSEDQQSAVARWMDALEAQRPAAPWLEIAAIGPVNAFVQGMIGAGMRRSIPESGRRARVITSLEPPDTLVRALGCRSSGRDVCVAVVDQGGDIRAVFQGLPDADLVRRVLDTLGSP